MSTCPKPASSARRAFSTSSFGDCSSEESQYPISMRTAYRARALVNSAAMAERHIVGLGGGGDTAAQSDLLYDYILGLTARARPRMLYVPTAVAEDPDGIVTFYERFGGRVEPSHLRTFPWPPENLRELILEQDAICVNGGEKAKKLALWGGPRGGGAPRGGRGGGGGVW